MFEVLANFFINVLKRRNQIRIYAIKTKTN